MRLGPGSHPRAEEGLGGVRSGGSNELVSRLTERTIRTKSDCLEADAQVLVADDLVGPAVLGGGVGVTWQDFVHALGGKIATWASPRRPLLEEIMPKTE